MARPVRLGKAASELNVGVQTLIDFLKSKEIAMDFTPNTKLQQEHLELLRAEFAEDQNLKEKAKGTSNRNEVKESISLKDQRKEVQEVSSPIVEEDSPINLEEIKQKALDKSKKEETKKSSLNVVGKINLDEINQKTRPTKKEEIKAPVEEVEKKEDIQSEVEEKSAKETETPKENNVSEEDSEEKIETVRVDRKKLSGPTVLGKIELPQKPAPSEENKDKKRKRKRIKKVNPTVASKGKTDNQKNYRKGKEEKKEISEEDIQKEIKETLARLSNKGGKSKGSKNRRAKREVMAQKRQEEIEIAELDQKTLKLTEFVTVSELATMMNVQSTQVISSCMTLGIFASINQRIDAETIQIIAEEFGFETEFVSAEVQESIQVNEDNEEDLESRPPIITVMGHVDHGKTSLLDRIRDANVTEGEAGGITQHIGAYSVNLKDGQKLTFLDTPGHEAFTAMRARGAQVTDVAIIIVAADDDVMPQTKEAISHAQAANVPMIFAINKIDKPGANTDKIKEQLSGMNILVEEWGVNSKVKRFQQNKIKILIYYLKKSF